MFSLGTREQHVLKRWIYHTRFFKILNREVDLGSSEVDFFVICNSFPNKPSINVIKHFMLDAAGFVFLFNSFCSYKPKNRAVANLENRLSRPEKFDFSNVSFKSKNKPLE